MDNPAPVPNAAPVEAASASSTAKLDKLDSHARIKRINKACLNCRKRKSRCLLETTAGAPQVPCLRCQRENLECVLGSSNRGGKRVRKSESYPDGFSDNGRDDIDDSPAAQAQYMSSPLYEPPPFHLAGQTAGGYGQPAQMGGVAVKTETRNPLSSFHSPSNALGILAHVAETSTGESDSSRTPTAKPPMGALRPQSGPFSQRGQASRTELFEDGKLTSNQTIQLVHRYQRLYHPYYPLAPRHIFDVSKLAENVSREPHLLTAILTIASKDLIEETYIYEACVTHMQKLVSELCAGKDFDVEAVEALLLLAEWTPYTQHSPTAKIGRGEEDREAWMHIGVAIRLAHLLNIDQNSSSSNIELQESYSDRRRLAWTACYIADRQISIRTGKAFSARCPSPPAPLRREGYPGPSRANPTEDDYAGLFQANFDLTQLFSNAHDVLYSNSSFSTGARLSDSHVKLIDDFRVAIQSWKSCWGTLTCSPHLKATLLVSYDFLRLYTNAFGFQDTLNRTMAVRSTRQHPKSSHDPDLHTTIVSVANAHFVYEGLDAAKSILSTLNQFIDPESTLRYFPIKHHLYLVYASVFLLRACCVGVVPPSEVHGIRSMVIDTANRMHRSAVSASEGEIGTRYSQLLRLLLEKTDRLSREKIMADAPPDQVPRTADPHLNLILSTPVRTPDLELELGSAEDAAREKLKAMGVFGWMDLKAASMFAMNLQADPKSLLKEKEFIGCAFLPFQLPVAAGWDLGQLDRAGMGLS
ncbi:hypothetical protein K402DRAFT_21281 [Aulographum hederae CBS 113979]|uniref:Zn(2)-C6 fungal-type domain-containing protein n=1 Tax=Aulographum hederae CBS 113979 TaxID=1176131 RepID=A0A6G1H7B8_9PEZI|nr:hypothetical protein K402DRAFT_21281 [Aulographum hederae CBS 113979]